MSEEDSVDLEAFDAEKEMAEAYSPRNRGNAE